MKKYLSLALAVLLLFGAFLVLPVHGEAGIYDNVIRLHVLARSDSERDQADKLAVRDAVLAVTKTLLLDVEGREEAELVLRDALPLLESEAERVLEARGSDGAVCVSLCRESYPRRTYEAMAFPAGEYVSLQVKIGDGKGQNFWCVLFPPLCLTAATADREATCLSAGLTEEQYRLITESEGGHYKLRFKLLEMAQALFP